LGSLKKPAPVASGGVALPNGWKRLFGEAIRAKCAPRRGGSQHKYRKPRSGIGAFGYFGCLTGAWRHFDSPVGAGSCVL